jgi:chromosome segregation ATPase
MKIKMLTALAGAEFALAHGEIVDAASVGGEDVARAWVAAGMAVEAPETEVAAHAVAAAERAMADAIAARDGLRRETLDLKSRLAQKDGALKGAIADRDLHAREAQAAREAASAAEAVAEDLRGQVATADAARDEFAAQAAALGAEIAALREAQAAPASEPAAV